MLQRDGAGETGKYSNTPSTALFLVKQSPQYIGGILEMANARLYPFWADLTAAYAPRVRRALRGVALVDRRRVVVQDEVEAAGSVSVGLVGTTAHAVPFAPPSLAKEAIRA